MGGAGQTPGTGGVQPNVGPTPDTATRARCTGTTQITCNFGGPAPTYGGTPPGNYDVTVVLGGTQAGNTQVWGEMGRPMLPPIQTAAGETKRFSFTINVRQPEGEPVERGPNAGTPGLQVYFQGVGGGMPQLQSIGFAPSVSPFMIYIASDSTVCDQPTTPFVTAGFGGEAQAIPQFFDFPVSIANYADSGEQSGSFLGSAALFGAITSRLKANDWVIIQFGHNDKTDSATTFHDNMTKLVMGVKAKGAFPLLVTPIARAQFTGTMVDPQHINQTGANLPMIVKAVGTETMTPVMDMTTVTTAWLMMVGPQGWQPFHANGTDVTHTSPAGAVLNAKMLVDLIKQANIAPLVSHLR
jgi:lysophospholipase L1-like esterase